MTEVLSRESWELRPELHQERVRPLVQARLDRRLQREKHPSDDFLFEYYHYRPAQILAWHPGWGFGLADPTDEYLSHRDYTLDGHEGHQVVTLTVDALERRRKRLERAVRIMAGTADRVPQFDCFTLHEWAMVYGLEPEQVRHAQLSLRLEPREIRNVVDTIGLRCSHFDAYRFFTPVAASKQARL